MILHGLLGPTLAPKNLSTVLTWVHFRGALVLVLLCAGNFFLSGVSVHARTQCGAAACFGLASTGPKGLRNKWISVALFVAILFTYELFDLWSSPWWTASLAVAYFVAVLVDRRAVQARFVLQVCLSDWPI